MMVGMQYREFVRDLDTWNEGIWHIVSSFKEDSSCRKAIKSWTTSSIDFDEICGTESSELLFGI